MTINGYDNNNGTIFFCLPTSWEVSTGWNGLRLKPLTLMLCQWKTHENNLKTLEKIRKEVKIGKFRNELWNHETSCWEVYSVSIWVRNSDFEAYLIFELCFEVNFILYLFRAISSIEIRRCIRALVHLKKRLKRKLKISKKTKTKRIQNRDWNIAKWPIKTTTILCRCLWCTQTDLSLHLLSRNSCIKYLLI